MLIFRHFWFWGLSWTGEVSWIALMRQVLGGYWQAISGMLKDLPRTGARDFWKSSPRRPSPKALTPAGRTLSTPGRPSRALTRHTFPSTSLPARQNGPRTGGEAVKERLS